MMNQYAVLIECVGCGTKSIWYLNSEASNDAVIQQEIDANLAILINADYNCDVCHASGMEILAIKEASDDPSQEDY